MPTVLIEAQRRALIEMGIAKRLAVTASLWEHARALKEAALRAQHPEWSPNEIATAARKALQRAER